MDSAQSCSAKAHGQARCKNVQLRDKGGGGGRSRSGGCSRSNGSTWRSEKGFEEALERFRTKEASVTYSLGRSKVFPS